MPIIAAAIIGGGMLASGAMASSAQSSANRQNVQAARENRDIQIELANTAHQREVQDLRAAGLNPILSGTGGPGAATPNIQAPEVQPVTGMAEAVGGAARGVGSAVMAKSQLDLLQAQTEKTRNEAFNAKQIGYGLEAGAHADVVEARNRLQAASYRMGDDERDAESYTPRERELYGGQHRAEVLRGALADAEVALKAGNTALARAQLSKVAQDVRIGHSAEARAKVQQRIWSASESELFEMATMLGGVVGQGTGGAFIGGYSARGIARDLEGRFKGLGSHPDADSFAP